MMECLQKLKKFFNTMANNIFNKNCRQYKDPIDFLNHNRY